MRPRVKHASGKSPRLAPKYGRGPEGSVTTVTDAKRPPREARRPVETDGIEGQWPPKRRPTVRGVNVVLLPVVNMS